MMNSLPHNPILVAEKAQEMAKRAGAGESKVFQNVAMCSMIVMAAAGATQLMLQVMRELRRTDDQKQGRSR